MIIVERISYHHPIEKIRKGEVIGLSSHSPLPSPSPYSPSISHLKSQLS